ncbi:hypothetical protein BGX23_008345 [Mortierella sp. AD031]|nr:hypothetical protein BGX23_008345 [Mortierella sp. AD031]
MELELELINHFIRLSADRHKIPTSQLSQHHIYPRAISSGLDAIICFHFIQPIHTMRTTNYSIVAFHNENHRSSNTA